MEFDNEFEVSAPIDEVWQTMLDIERVAPCVPGAKVVEQSSDEAYKVEIKVKMGPVSMTYKGDVEIVEADEAEHRAILRTNAREARGQGTAKATVELRLAEADGKTRGTIHADVSLSGRAASMGRGIIQDVSAKMIDTFAQNLAAMLTGPAPASETGNGSAPTSEAAATATATMPRQQQQAAPADALDAGELARGMLLARLRDPRVVGVIGVVLLILLLRRRR